MHVQKKISSIFLVSFHKDNEMFRKRIAAHKERERERNKGNQTLDFEFCRS